MCSDSQHQQDHGTSVGRQGDLQTLQHSLSLGLKRLLDVILGLVVLLLIWPGLLLIAILVKATSPGPVLFTQERVGRGERLFRLVKFRSMTGSPPRGLTTWNGAEEARITPVGRFLRDYGLDELPQLWNILKGDMSIVGPRPPLAVQAEEYTLRQRKLFQMRPGVLSLAAVEGRRSLPVERRIELHVQYVESWSLKLDMEILWRGLFVVLSRRDAVETVRQQEDV
jgi:undecaprenyl phosphate N,N'-diacetylbacillosamine 1-phosphate transferase